MVRCRIRGTCGCFDPGGIRPGVAIGDVVGQAAVGQERVLGNETDLPAQGFARQVLNRHAVEADAAGIRRLETQQQLQQRALAAAGGADQTDCGAAGDGQIDAVQDGGVAVAEAHIFEAKLTCHRLCQRRTAVVGRHRQRAVHARERPVIGGGQRLLDHLDAELRGVRAHPVPGGQRIFLGGRKGMLRTMW